MKRKHKIYLGMTIFLLTIYIGLLAILCVSEYSDSTATIRSFKDAFWYSLVTLTTVGYGDLTPVTPLGQAVGVVFLLMSAGIMMTLFGAAVSLSRAKGSRSSCSVSSATKAGIILRTAVWSPVPLPPTSTAKSRTR